MTVVAMDSFQITKDYNIIVIGERQAFGNQKPQNQIMMRFCKAAFFFAQV